MKVRSSYAASVAVVLSVVLTLTPYSQGEVSQAVVASSNINAVNLINRALSNALQASDVRATVVSLGTLFAHLQETGTNQKVQEQMLAHEDEFLNKGITEEQIQVQYAYTRSQGSQLLLPQFRSVLITTQVERQSLMAELKTQGLWGMEQQLLARLNLAEARMPHERLSPRVSLMNLNITRIEVKGCALLAAIFAAGAFFCPPLAIIAAIYAILDALGVC